jgi:hypothetical protein
MAKATKTKKVVIEKDTTEKVKVASIFDHLANITDRKTPWSELSEMDKKSFSPFMINRFLSMNMDFIELVNELQRYTVGQLTPEQTYKLLSDILPKQKQFNKYIKGKKEDQYNSDLVNLVRKHFDISQKESLEYLDLFYQDRLITLKEIVKKYGKTDKQVEQLLKLEK